MLNRAFPRSVAYNYSQINACLEKLAEDYGGAHDCQHTAQGELTRLKRLNISTIFEDGLHEFIDEQLATTARINMEVSEAYHF